VVDDDDDDDDAELWNVLETVGIVEEVDVAAITEIAIIIIIMDSVLSTIVVVELVLLVVIAWTVGATLS